jgi:hypothetical protein
MGHRDTLANFIDWSMTRYPAENYYLAIDDHGDGAYGISLDRNSDDDLLTPEEVYAALRAGTNNGSANRKIDIFDYEACLMGLVENAYDVREWTNYVVFFEQISWALDTYPEYFKDLQAADTPLQVGQRIIDRYYAEAIAANGGRGYPHTISLIDTSKLEAVEQATSALADVLKTKTPSSVSQARNASQAFANDSDATNSLRAEYIDLWDFADKVKDLAPPQAAAVKTAVDAAVVTEKKASGGVDGYLWNHNRAHGLSIYYPPTKSSGVYSRYPTRYQMSVNGSWDEFLAAVLAEGDRRGMSAARAEDKLTSADAFIFRGFGYLPIIRK